MAIDQYSNGCEAGAIMDDGTNVAIIFIEGKIICRFELQFICIKKLRQIGLQLYDASWFASCVSDLGSQVYLNVALMKDPRPQHVLQYCGVT